MLAFDKQKFATSLTSDHINGGHFAIQKYGISHNHNNLIYDYLSTDYFKETNSKLDHSIYADVIWEESGKETWNKLLDKYRYWLNDTLKENTSTTDELVEKVVLESVKYFSVNCKGDPDKAYRFSPNKLQHIDINAEYIKTLYNDYNNALNNIFPENFHYQNLCGACWMLLEANYCSEDVIEITSYYFNSILGRKSSLYQHYTDTTGVDFYKNQLGDNPRGLDNFWRALLSISWPLAQSLKYHKRYDEASLIYKITKKLTKQHIHYSTGRNRILEAAIEDYKLFPTQENKEWCYEMLHDVSKTEIDNSTENTNEIFLIFYMFYKHVLGKKLK